MALTDADLTDIDGLLGQYEDSLCAIGDLRRRFPAFTVTRCDPSDVDLETPFRVWQRFSLYLVDGADHCWKLTSDASRATGLVVVAHKVAP